MFTRVEFICIDWSFLEKTLSICLRFVMNRGREEVEVEQDVKKQKMSWNKQNKEYKELERVRQWVKINSW
jgi:hypothetical protein